MQQFSSCNVDLHMCLERLLQLRVGLAWWWACWAVFGVWLAPWGGGNRRLMQKAVWSFPAARRTRAYRWNLLLTWGADIYRSSTHPKVWSRNRGLGICSLTRMGFRRILFPDARKHCAKVLAWFASARFRLAIRSAPAFLRLWKRVHLSAHGIGLASFKWLSKHHSARPS